jgi:hypothetical protein
VEKQVSELLKWYRIQRSELIQETYLDKSTAIKRVFIPYSNWDNDAVLEKEITFNIKAIARLRDLLTKFEAPVTQSSLAIVVLALKNRLEYASTQSDFYPVLMTLISTACAFFAMEKPAMFRVGAGFVAFISIAFLTYARIIMRHRTSAIKELINILELYKSDHI